ncbi:ABC transporter ATP-binding protein [Corticimicrobacter populi]|uniref:ABC transporter ATP-binding protein n=1 Tax=Corticimicrobacter populi TaxID=2175229 RepID=A0A2V1K2L8_9BURK|nr:ATP-binding cassette domain-containing protein [Corticimicrobacter populi]PWF22533.1 ABC transporter ATP-binding protein [Corticimicrobacter populi]
MLTLDNVSVRLAGASVLRGVTGTLLAGTAVAVVGHNGAGKTTLLRTIMGLARAHEGRILLGNDDLMRWPAHRRAGLGIGYAPEERVIFPTMTVLENLRLPCEVDRLPDTDIQARLEMVLDVVPQLGDMLPRSGAALSGGQGKMVALGRALMIGTRMVLLDEPFQGLAPVLALQYAEALGRLRQICPELCIVITESNASLLQDIPDQTLVLARGALVEGAH